MPAPVTRRLLPGATVTAALLLQLLKLARVRDFLCRRLCAVDFLVGLHVFVSVELCVFFFRRHEVLVGSRAELVGGATRRHVDTNLAGFLGVVAAPFLLQNAHRVRSPARSRLEAVFLVSLLWVLFLGVVLLGDVLLGVFLSSVVLAVLLLVVAHLLSILVDVSLVDGLCALPSPVPVLPAVPAPGVLRTPSAATPRTTERDSVPASWRPRLLRLFRLAPKKARLHLLEL
mmetsp:Transcript_31088/g.78715  ORF Transcript_31088/g.78715 Transcript_31088/m.78715 type:complete len:230 (+) Transcript_31088:630-1319(+)